MLPPIAPAIRASSVLSRSSANRHPAISRSIQAFASRAIGTSPSHRDANGREASLFDTIDCYLRREQTMWVIASRLAAPRAAEAVRPPARHQVAPAVLLRREAALELGQRAREVGSGHGANIPRRTPHNI